LIAAGCGGTAAPATAPQSAQPPSAEPAPWTGDGTMVAPGVISTRHYELNAAETPDGQTMFFTLSSPQRNFRDYTIMMSERVEGAWGAPQVAPFSGTFSDADPLVSPDGSRVYFISSRPAAGKPDGRDFDLWYVERTADGFGEAVNLGAPINSDIDEFYVSVTNSGTVYFSTRRDGAVGGSDIFRSELRDGVYQAPEPLPATVNSPGPEFDPYIAPDESYVLFSSFREDSLGSADIYISYRQPDGTWTQAVNAGPAVNSPAFEFCPIVSADGTRLYYTGEKRRPDSENARTDYASFGQHFDRIDNGLGNVYEVPLSALPARP